VATAEDPKLVATLGRLRLDAAAAEVLGGFEVAGVKTLLLKGRSIASWLYADGELRTYVDCDLLIAPGDLRIAEEVLDAMAFTRVFDDRGMPAWWREHASAWLRDDDGFVVDLHRTLPGVGVDAEAMWRVLAADTDVVMVARRPARALSLAARALHVALHAAQHGAGWIKPMADLERALAIGDDDLWRQADLLATGLEARDAFAAGLRLAPAGVRLAGRLGLPPPRSVDAALRATSPPPVALALEQLARARGIRARLEIVWRKLVPPAAFIRHWDPSAADSRSALLRAYLRRPLWILRHTPRALLAWHRARRSVDVAPERFPRGATKRP
jgi:Uncharacterised nucleotidyltransferase